MKKKVEEHHVLLIFMIKLTLTVHYNLIMMTKWIYFINRLCFIEFTNYKFDRFKIKCKFLTNQLLIKVKIKEVEIKFITRIDRIKKSFDIKIKNF